MVDGKAAGKLPDRDRTGLRRGFLGFVYQYHHLLPEFSAVENVMLPQMLNGVSRTAARKRAGIVSEGEAGPFAALTKLKKGE